MKLIDILKYLGIKHDQYHTLLTFLGVDWHKNKFIPDSETIEECKRIIEEYGKGKELARYIKKENSIKRYGLSSPNMLIDKRIKSSNSLKKKYADGYSWGGNIKGVNSLTEQECEIKTQNKELELKNKYCDDWKNLTKKDKFHITCLKNNVTQESKTKSREKNLKKKFPGFVIFNRYYDSNYFFHYLLENKFLTEYKDVGRLHLVLEKEILNPVIKTEYIKYQEIAKNSGKSHYEDEIVNYLKYLRVKNIIRNTRKIIAPKELDIYLPDYKLGIEFNGLYWHSDKWQNDNACLEKHNLALSKNIKLLQFYEDEWIFKKEICKSIIRNNLNLNIKIYARNCIFKKIPTNQGKEFVNNNHIHGSVNGGNYYGLYYKNDLIQVIQLGKSRFDNKKTTEVIRMCSKIGFSVVGGFSKILKNIPYDYLISYVDKRFFNGIGYNKCGWKFIKDCSPNYYYIVNNQRENRLKYQKHKLKSILPNYDEKLTEKQNMIKAGYHYICDAGNYKFEWKRS